MREIGLVLYAENAKLDATVRYPAAIVSDPGTRLVFMRITTIRLIVLVMVQTLILSSPKIPIRHYLLIELMIQAEGRKFQVIAQVPQ